MSPSGMGTVMSKPFEGRVNSSSNWSNHFFICFFTADVM